MQPPKTVKEVQCLTGRVATLNRFISRSTDKCLPFFKTLRKAFQWTPESEEAFAQLKTYLSSPPLLSRAVTREELYIYLVVSLGAVSSALMREELGDQKPIFYVNRAYRGVEVRYPLIEQLAFALVISAQRLCPNFCSHTIVVLTDQPLRQVLQKPKMPGRLVQCSIELGKFDIQYPPCRAMKKQVMAEFTNMPQERTISRT